MTARASPWIHSRWLDGAFILAPPFFAVAFVLAFRDAFGDDSGVPLWAWVVFILAIDVAHVYSTLYRTYFDPVEFNARRTLYTVVPLLAWVGGALLYAAGPAVFWRVLAYIAVFHFVRQQYGFMVLYARRERSVTLHRWIDRSVIYLATIYPLVYWHTHPRQFHWFIEGDFFTLPAAVHAPVLAAYLLSLAAYAIKEAAAYRASGHVNWPKQYVVIGTAGAWYVGIVLLNGDMAFTVTNVVSHGIPYLALIWIYGRRQAQVTPARRLFGGLRSSYVFSVPFLPVFIGLLLLFAYVEEGLWHGLVWREHLSAFVGFADLPKLEDSAALALVVSLLAVPQLTHYILDGFIWKLKATNRNGGVRSNAAKPRSSADIRPRSNR